MSHRTRRIVVLAVITGVMASSAAGAIPGVAHASSCVPGIGFATNANPQGLATVVCPYTTIQVCLDASSQVSGWSQVAGSCALGVSNGYTSASNPYHAYSNAVACISGVVYRAKWGSGSSWTYGGSRSFC